jgi:hypothetical protein
MLCPEMVAVCGEEAESLTCGVNAKLPATVGVPLIAPDAESVSPAGNEPEATDHVYGVVPPVVCNTAE